MSRFAGLVSAGLLAAGLATAPASATPVPTITYEAPGSDMIVAGASPGTQLVATAINDSGLTATGPLVGQVDPGLLVTDVSSTSATCSASGTYWQCDPIIVQNGGQIVVTISVIAESTLPTGSYSTCAQWDWTGLVGAPNGPTLCVENAASRSPRGFRGTAVEFAPLTVIRQVKQKLGAMTLPSSGIPGQPALTTLGLSNGGPSSTGPTVVQVKTPLISSAASDASSWVAVRTGDVTSYTYTPALGSPTRRFEAPIPDLGLEFMIPAPSTVSSYEVPVVAFPLDATNLTPEDSLLAVTIPVEPVKYTLSKKADGRFRVGHTGQWKISLTNTGTFDDAGRVTIADKLPKSLEYVSAAGDGWDCSVVDGTLSCSRPKGLAAGATSTITVTTKGLVAGLVENTATLQTESYSQTSGGSARVFVRRLPQTAKPLPATPARIASGKTDQGRRISTRVRCRPALAATAGEVSYCRVTRRDGVVRVRVVGEQKVVVVVTQTAPGTKKYRPFLQRKVYVEQSE